MASAPAAPDAAAFLALLRAAERASQDFADFLRPCGLSPAQYNVLRILRGAGPDGLPCGEIGGRMLNKDPDITRLLDRMEKQGWIGRERNERDRRVVVTRLTKTGQALVNRLDEPVARRHQETLGRLGKKRLTALARELRAAAESFPSVEASK
jgi:DNA-binding MarR family transcriptional regulator